MHLCSECEHTHTHTHTKDQSCELNPMGRQCFPLPATIPRPYWPINYTSLRSSSRLRVQLETQGLSKHSILRQTYAFTPLPSVTSVSCNEGLSALPSNTDMLCPDYKIPQWVSSAAKLINSQWLAVFTGVRSEVECRSYATLLVNPQIWLVGVDYFSITAAPTVILAARQITVLY